MGVRKLIEQPNFNFFLHTKTKICLIILCEVLGMLNGGQFGSATAGGAGNGAVQGAKIFQDLCFPNDGN